MSTKYRAVKTEVDGLVFDSKGEARRYGALKIMERAGLISQLELQPKFELQAGFRAADGKRQRAIHYVADFSYVENCATIIEDYKGMETAVFKLKKKLFQAKYPELTLRITKG